MAESPLAKIKESLDSLHSAVEGQNQYLIPNPDSFTQNYDATVGSCRGRAKHDFDALSEHIKRLDGQIVENAIAIKREAGRLPGRTYVNPKRQINVVLLRRGRSLNPSTIEINQAEKHADVERTGENRSRPVILDSPNPESEIPRESERSNTEDAAIDLEEEEEELEEDLEIDRQEGTNVDRPTAVNIDRQTESNIDRRSTPAEPVVDSVCKTLPPFPPKKMQTKRELDKHAALVIFATAPRSQQSFRDLWIFEVSVWSSSACCGL
ncbi:hypothetical protein DY000_02010559 [Brassica cretica]|uniref:Uncharacterized protein n=1 Tax=Brassica cretica TaxID=69181 RepID=A0ABQ7BYP1_BRACR|nr:hypothetical protein DY000_02010559 [Brassica cretica]